MGHFSNIQYVWNGRYRHLHEEEIKENLHVTLEHDSPSTPDEEPRRAVTIKDLQSSKGWEPQCYRDSLTISWDDNSDPGKDLESFLSKCKTTTGIWILNSSNPWEPGTNKRITRQYHNNKEGIHKLIEDASEITHDFPYITTSNGLWWNPWGTNEEGSWHH